MEKLALRAFAENVKDRLCMKLSESESYAWFSRLLELRYMTANGIIDTGLFSSKFKSDFEAAEKTAEIYVFVSKLYPHLFTQKITLCTVPDGLTNIISEFASCLDDDLLRNNVQIIGWLYQFYISEPRKRKIRTLKREERIADNKIALSTQIFTPDWIVHYMVENTLGKLWTEKCPDMDTSSWLYLAEKSKMCSTEISPESITFIDPCMGCGNILVYAFDVFMDIYKYCGYSDDEASKLILEKNIFGFDIDRNAHELAVFSLYMKAAEYSTEVLKADISLNLLEFSTLSDNSSFGDELKNCHIYGSLIKGGNSPCAEAQKLWSALAGKYDVVVTNPPYMSCSSMNEKLMEYLRANYSDYRSDLFSAFLYRCSLFTKDCGYSAFFTPYVWLFIQSYEKLRRFIFTTNTVESLVQFEYSSFRDATVPVCMFTMKKDGIGGKGIYIKLSEFKGDMEVQRKHTLEALRNRKCGYVYYADSKLFTKLPDAAAAYWMTERTAGLYEKCLPLSDYASPRKGNSTSDNDRFLRRWYEVDINRINLHCVSLKRENTLEKYWFPYNKGGGYRKWYGFNSFLINWYDDGAAIREIPSAVIANYKYFMKPGLTWSTLTSGSFSIRWFGEGYIFDNGGCCIFDLDEKREYFCALLNSKVFSYIFVQMNPTLNFQSGDVAKFPVVYSPDKRVDELTDECIMLSKEEYDCFETSINFRRHPLV